MEQTSYSKLSQRDVDRAETDLLINLSTLAGAGLASLLETSTPWGAGIGAGIGLLGSLF